MDLPSLLPQATLFPHMVPCLVPELPAPWHSWHMPDPGGLFHSSHDPWSRLGSNSEILCEKVTRFNVREAELHCYNYREVSHDKQYEAGSVASRVGGVSSSLEEGVTMRCTSSRHKYMRAQEATKLYRRRSRSLPSETDIFDLYPEDDKNHKIERHTEPVVTQIETQFPETKMSPDLLSEVMSKATDEGYNSYKKVFRINTLKLNVSPEINKRSPRATTQAKNPASLKRSISLPTDQELIKTRDELMISSPSPAVNPHHSADHNEQLLSDYLKNWKEDFELNRDMIDLNSRNSASDGIDFSDSCSDSDSTISSVGGEAHVFFCLLSRNGVQ